MATQRRFEGSSLDAVLAKVQKEVGTNAKIVSAQRMRSGGVGGFFAREKFEVLVDIPDPGEAASSAQPSAANSTMEGPTRVASAPPSTTLTVPATSDDENYDPVASLLSLAEKISKEDINEVQAPPAPPSPSVAKMAQPGPNVDPVVPEPPQKTEAKTEQAEMETAAEPEVLKADEPQISTETDSFAEVLSRVAFQAHMTDEQDRAQQEAAAERSRRRVEEDIPGRPAFLDTNIVEAEPEPEPEPELVAQQPAQSPQPVAQTPVVPEQTRHLPDLVPANRTRITDHPLATLGLPTEYIPVNVAADGLQEALTSALDRLLPKTPDIRPSKGSVVCVVGSRFEALEVAGEIAEQFGRPAEEIILASQNYRGKGAANVLRTVRNAEDAQRSWSRRPRPTIVAIEANPGLRDSSWAEHVLTALEPIATYGVADATRKSDDIKAWADSLGGIDCLAINNIDETVSPAAVLATGIPVDRVDGRRVSAAYWALLLTERLLVA